MDSVEIGNRDVHRRRAGIGHCCNLGDGRRVAYRSEAAGRTRDRSATLGIVIASAFRHEPPAVAGYASSFVARGVAQARSETRPAEGEAKVKAI